jgi:hypothetical protein
VLRLTFARSRRGLLRSIADLHDRASTHKTRADMAEHRIERALALLDERGVAHDDALRLTLKGDLL